MTDYSNDPHQNPYWQNINGQNNQNNGGWENRQNTRNTDPNWHPEENLGRQLGGTASMLGILALCSGLLLPVLLPLPLAGLAILLAIISKGRSSEYPRKARNGLITGIVALILNLVILAGVLISSFRMMSDPEYMEQFNETFENMYGSSMEDLFDDIGDSYGITLEEGEGYL